MTNSPMKRNNTEETTAPESLSELKVMLVAGEASSDAHGAELVRGLKTLAPGVQVFGMGGSELRSVGMETVIDSEKIASVMGITEILGSLRGLLRARGELIQVARQRKPNLVVFIDFPDFNLSVAKRLSKEGFRTMYFISPQLWAWRRGRITLMQRFIDGVAVIFPFEATLYKKHGVKSEFVGNPLTDQSEDGLSKAEARRTLNIGADERIIALLPGSRRGELSRLLPDFLDGFRKLHLTHPNIRGIIPVATTLSLEELQKSIPADLPVTCVQGRAREVLVASDAGIVASGTATIEAALAGLPFIVAYKLSPISYIVGRLLVRHIQHFAMPNVIAGEQIVPEFLQHEVTGERLAHELERILDDELYRKQFVARLSVVRDKLRFPEADGLDSGLRAAKFALELIQSPEAA